MNQQGFIEEENLPRKKHDSLHCLLLSKKNEPKAIQILHAIADADVIRHTVLFGDDTDLLVLLCHHATAITFPIYLQLLS